MYFSFACCKRGLGPSSSCSCSFLSMSPVSSPKRNKEIYYYYYYYLEYDLENEYVVANCIGFITTYESVRCLQDHDCEVEYPTAEL